MKTGDYNPHFFNYGSLMIYLNLLVDKLHYFYLSTFTSEIQTLSDIKINSDTGWHWTISHPSFYYWNRILTVILGIGAIIATYYIAKVTFNIWIAIISALFLTVLPLHIRHSAYITTDIPMQFFVMCTILSSLLYVKSHKSYLFILSLICTGLAIATKYNAGIVYIIPLISLLLNAYKSKKIVIKDIFYLFTIPVITFVIVMPYAILDFTTFIQAILYEMHHYNVKGHHNATITPGLNHLLLQFQNIYQNIGLIPTIFTLIGLFSLIRKPLLIFILIFPIVYLFYMTGTKVSFHRNFLILYPFISILLGAGFYYTLVSISELIPKKFVKSINIFTALIVMLFLGSMLHNLFKSINLEHRPDTRTQSIDLLNDRKNIKQIIIAKELKYHQNDLKKLQTPYIVLPIETIANMQKPEKALYVIPIEIKNRFSESSKEQKQKQNIINEVKKNNDYFEIDGAQLYLDRNSINPGIMLVQRFPTIDNSPTLISLDTCSFDSNSTILSYLNYIKMIDGSLNTSEYKLSHGKYQFFFEAHKDASYNIKNKKIKIKNYDIDVSIRKDRGVLDKAVIVVNVYSDSTILSSSTISLSNEYTKYFFSFILKNNKNIRIGIKYIDNSTGNKPFIYIKNLGIEKL